MTAFTLTSPAFTHGAGMPARYTCDGEDVSPPLEWTAPPEGTQSLVLIVDDPDAPDPERPRTRWVHWVLFDLPPSTRSLSEGAKATGGHEGLNDSERAGWSGPCPPIGRHRYVFRLFAVDRLLKDLVGAAPTRDEVLRQIAGHELARAELIGTYERARVRDR